MKLDEEMLALAKEYREMGEEEIAKGFEDLSLRVKEKGIEASYYDDVREFHRLWHEPPLIPVFLDPKAWANRVRLINEEWSELTTAYALGDEAKFADSLVDLTWVVLGTAVVAGLPFDDLWAEVRKSNMAKKGGGIDKAGKLIKPPGWKPPDIDGVLRKAFDNDPRIEVEDRGEGRGQVPRKTSGKRVPKEMKGRGSKK